MEIFTREMGWAVLFLLPCTVMDLLYQKIGTALLAAGAAGAVCIAGVKLAEGRTDFWEIAISLLPGLLLWGCSFLTEGKVGRGDGDMVLMTGLISGWRLCVGTLCAACLLSAIWAGIGLAAGKLKKDSRLPFAPFLLTAALGMWLWNP